MNKVFLLAADVCSRAGISPRGAGGGKFEVGITSIKDVEGTEEMSAEGISMPFSDNRAFMSIP
jgi:hypothetical protein